MGHSKLGSVQHRLRWVPGTVEPITDHRVTDRCQGDADLMRASRPQLGPEKRALPRASQRDNVGGGAFSVLADAEANWSDAGEGRVDGLGFGEGALAEG